jgi:sec-independent protein translocase protein TatC
MATPSQPDSTTRPREGDENGAGKMSFFEHLVELRKRIIHSLLAVGIGVVAGFFVAEKAIGFLVKPMVAALHDAHLADKLVYTNPTGFVVVLIHTGFYLGFVLASPYVLYQVWLFIAPGLYRHERRGVLTFVISATLLFLAGMAFAYWIMLPYVLKFLISFQGPFTPLISINEYFDLILIVLIGLGLIFELPVLIFFLSLFGIVTPRFLWTNARYAILIITIIAAIVTPSPDATTMLIFMAPMVLLYFAGIGVSYLVVRRKRMAAIADEGAQ